MLSSLPTELIREIIESAVPHTFHSTTYKDRQRTLCSLSLVSKFFRSIAQPFLLEIVWIKSASEIDRLPVTDASSIGQPGRGVQCAVVESSRLDDARSLSEKVASLERALRLLRSVTTLTVTGVDGGYVDLRVFEDFPDLTHLQLTGRFWMCSQPPVLPKIQSLTLNDLSFETMEVLLTRSTLPNLKEFALADADSECSELLERSGFRQLLPQLEALCLDIWIWKDPSAVFLHSAASRTLVDCDYGELFRLKGSGRPVVNLRFYEKGFKVDEEWVRIFREELDDYALESEAEPTERLQRIYLDPSLEGSFKLLKDPHLSLANFIRLYQENNIELIFDCIPNFRIDPCFPSNFMRRRRTPDEGLDTQNSDR